MNRFLTWLILINGVQNQMTGCLISVLIIPMMRTWISKKAFVITNRIRKPTIGLPTGDLLIHNDGEGNRTEVFYYYWDPQTNNWKNLKKVEHYWSDTTISSTCGPCLDETFTAPTGSFSDNSCDEDYNNFADCRKLIQIPDADYINLEFTEFNIEPGMIMSGSMMVQPLGMNYWVSSLEQRCQN